MLDSAAEVEKQMKKLRGFALRLCRDRCEADDLVQDTMLRAIEKREQFQQGTNLTAWLFTICRNMFLSDKRKKRMLAEDAEGIFTAYLPSSADTLGALEAKDAISHIVLLPAMYQRVLMLASSGQSYDQMAEAVGVSVGTIKSRLHRARNMLAELLGEPLEVAE